MKLIIVSALISISTPTLATEYSDCAENLAETLDHSPSPKEIEDFCGELNGSPTRTALECIEKAHRASALKPTVPVCSPVGVPDSNYRYAPQPTGAWWTPIQPFFEGKTFAKFPVRGDGNCAFTAMDVSREEAVAELEKILGNPRDPRFSEVVQYLSQSYYAEARRIELSKGEAATSDLKSTINQLNRASRRPPDTEETAAHILTPDLARQFLHTVFARQDFYANYSAIRLVGSIFKKNILIVQSPGESPGAGRTLQLSAGAGSAFIQPGNTETKILLHDGVHFDRLVDTSSDEYVARRLQAQEADAQHSREVAKTEQEGKDAALAKRLTARDEILAQQLQRKEEAKEKEKALQEKKDEALAQQLQHKEEAKEKEKALQEKKDEALARELQEKEMKKTRPLRRTP